MNIISGIWINPEQTRADLVIDHPDHGPIPYTYDPTDPHGCVTSEEVTEYTLSDYQEPLEYVPTSEELTTLAKQTGFNYNGITVPVTNEDAMGAMQIKMGFEDYGLQTTSFHLSNGEKLTLTLAEWPDFSLLFFSERAKHF